MVATDGQSAIVTTGSTKHSHQILQDPASGQPMLYPAPDGHTHVIKPLQEIIRKPSEGHTETEIVSDIKSLHQEAIENDVEFREQGKESEDYYYGDTWKETEKTKLNADKRAPSTVNEIEPKIDVLSGYQRQNRYDIRFLPIEDGDVAIADVLNILWKHVSEQNQYDHKESRVFDDCAITGLGVFQMRIDRDEDPQGKVVIERYPWNGVRFGPHEEPDLSDLEYLIKERWYSKNKIKSLWPEKADKIESSYSLAADLDKSYQPRGDVYKTNDNTIRVGTQGSERYVDLLKKNILVCEVWRKEYRKVAVLFNPTVDFYLSGENYNESDLKTIANEIDGFQIISRKTARMRVTTIANDVLLDDDYAEKTYGDYPIIPIYAKKRGKRIWGKVHVMKYLAKENNALHSKFIDIIDKAAGHGWFYDEQTFSNPAMKSEFEKVRNKTGWSVQVSDLNRLPVKVEGVKVPTELVALIDHNSQKMREISNVVNEMLGLNSRAESGVAIDMKKQQGLIGNEYLFDNLRLAKNMIGKRFIKMIPEVFTPKKIMRILENQNAKSPLKIAGVPYDQLTPDKLIAIEQVLSQEDYTDYDIAVSEAKTNPTTRMANMELAIQLTNGFPEIRQSVIDLMINMTDFADKDEWIQRIQQVQMMQQQLAAANTVQGSKSNSKSSQKAAPMKGTPATQ